MHYDNIMEGLLLHAETPTLESFGGLERVLADGKGIGASLFPDMFVDLVLPHRGVRRSEVDGFLSDILMVIERGPELDTIATQMLALHLQDGVEENKVFRRLLGMATDGDRSARLRTAALKGALAFARDDDIRIARMISEISDTQHDDDPIFIAHAARVAGVLAARTHAPALVRFLELVRDVEGSSDQVMLELGLLSLQSAIESSDTATVLLHLHSAHEKFDRAASLRESRYDACLYRSAIRLLIGFHQRDVPSNFECLLKDLRQNAFAYTEYSLATRQDPILGSIATQVAALVSLAEHLSTLVQAAEEDVWLHAIHVIEEHLLFAYEANRSVFAGLAGQGIDCVIRPMLEPKVFANRYHLKQLTAWLRDHSSKFDADLTRDLRAAVELVYQGDDPFPSEAVSGNPLGTALIERVRGIDDGAANGLSALWDVVQASAQQQFANLTVPVQMMMETVKSQFATLRDYQRPAAHMDFNVLVLRLATFLEQKLDSSVEQDRFSAYLFKHSKPLPVEKDLQQDFLRHGQSSGLPVDDEVKGVAGGRADIRYKSNGNIVIVEVKRELKDATFENLLRSYGDQTVIYQATNLKLGVMLVLDLSKNHGSPGVAHMDTWYATSIGDFLKDGTERGVLVVKIPGRRGTPSAATVAAKKRKARPVTVKKVK